MSERKKWVIISSLIVGLPIAAFLIVNAVLVYRSDREVAARLEAIRAAGDPVTISDFTVELPPEEDARAILATVQVVCKRTLEVDKSSKLKRMAAARVVPGSSEALNLMSQYVWPNWPPPTAGPTSAVVDPIPSIHRAANAKGWSRIVDPSQSTGDWIGDGYLSGNGTEAEDNDLIHGASQVLHLHIRYCLRYDRTADAVDDVVAMLSLAKTFNERTPSLWHRLAVAGIRHAAYVEANSLLQGYSLAEDDVIRIEAALEAIDLAAELDAFVKAERACLVTRLQTDTTISRDWFSRRLANRKVLDELDAAGRFVEDPESISDLTHSSTFAEQSFKGSLASYSDCYTRQCAEYRAIRVLAALYQMEHPDSLHRPDGTLDPAELSLPKEVTTDPYSGKPLIIRKGKNGLVRLQRRGKPDRRRRGRAASPKQ